MLIVLPWHRKILRFLLFKCETFPPVCSCNVKPFPLPLFSFLMWKFHLLKYLLGILKIMCPLVSLLSLKGETTLKTVLFWWLKTPSFHSVFWILITSVLPSVTALHWALIQFKQSFTTWMKSNRLCQGMRIKQMYMPALFSFSFFWQYQWAIFDPVMGAH